MKFIANENISNASIALLRNAGLSVWAVKEFMRGVSDKSILKYAVKEQLIILTNDRDYGELIFLYMAQSPPAVIYFRLEKEMPEDAGKILLDLIKNKIEFENYFTVVENDRVRQRKL